MNKFIYLFIYLFIHLFFQKGNRRKFKMCHRIHLLLISRKSKRFQYLVCSKWPPPASQHSWHLSMTLWQTFWQRSRFCPISANESVTNCLSSSKLAGFLSYTIFFITPQKKKSIGVRSGLRGGHSMPPRRPIQRFGNSWLRKARTNRE